MAGIINKTARQIDVRGRDASGIVHATLNPGFNVVDDEAWAAIIKNKHVGVLIDGGALIAGVKKTAEELDLERAAADAEAKAINELQKPDNPAAVVQTTPTKDPNAVPTKNDINPATGKKYTAKELAALQPSDDALDLGGE
jgi:hypothetical protein